MIAVNSDDYFFEVELLAAGLTVDGEKKQQQLLTDQSQVYHWNCHFSKSGNYTLSFIFRVLGPFGNKEVNSLHHNVKVVKIDHLTVVQMRLVVCIASAVAFLLSIVKALYQFG